MSDSLRTDTVKHQPSFAIALTDAEIEAFFPGELRRELFDMFPETRRFTGSNADSLARFLLERQTQVLLSGWGAPPLSPFPLPEALTSDLRYVCHLTGSVRNLVPRERIEAGLRVSNWGDGAAETVAENVLMLILAALRRTQYWGREMHERAGWRQDYGGARTLFDRRVAIHGFGRIARALLPMLAPFRTHVSVFSAGVPAEYVREYGAEPIPSLTELFESDPDILIELEALTPASIGTVTESHLRRLGPGTVFVNSGRGAVVDEAALERIAAEGSLHVALDVYTTEPLPAESPLRGLPNVTLMPHMGGPTVDRYPTIGRFALDNLRRWRDGEPLLAEVDLGVYDAST